MEITLYYCPKTRATRIQWLLEELQIPYQLEYINIFKGAGQTEEYRAIHPYGQVPAIKIDNQIIFESGAICNVLADKFPDKSLSPKLNSQERAEYEQWMFYAPATLEPPIFHYLLHSSIYPAEQRITEIADWNLKSFRQVLITLEKIFKSRMSDKAYIVGDKFSCADIMIGSVLFWAPDLVSKYATLHKYSQRLKSRTAYQRTLTTQ
ncbi:MAG: glutathione S-transferase family protein [Gammaproteobacteria bacterium]